MPCLVNALAQEFGLGICGFKRIAHLLARFGQLIEDLLAPDQILFPGQLQPPGIQIRLLFFDVVDCGLRERLPIGKCLRVSIYLVNGPYGHK